MKIAMTLIVLAFCGCLYAIYKGDKGERADIRASCAQYLHLASTRSDSMMAHVACDQLWSNKQTKDMAAAAVMMAASAAASSAANSSTRYPR